MCVRVRGVCRGRGTSDGRKANARVNTATGSRRDRLQEIASNIFTANWEREYTEVDGKWARVVCFKMKKKEEIKQILSDHDGKKGVLPRVHGSIPTFAVNQRSLWRSWSTPERQWGINSWVRYGEATRLQQPHVHLFFYTYSHREWNNKLYSICRSGCNTTPANTHTFLFQRKYFFSSRNKFSPEILTKLQLPKKITRVHELNCELV